MSTAKAETTIQSSADQVLAEIGRHRASITVTPLEAAVDMDDGCDTIIEAVRGGHQFRIERLKSRLEA